MSLPCRARGLRLLVMRSKPAAPSSEECDEAEQAEADGEHEHRIYFPIDRMEKEGKKHHKRGCNK